MGALDTLPGGEVSVRANGRHTDWRAINLTICQTALIASYISTESAHHSRAIKRGTEKPKFSLFSEYTPI